MIKPIKPKERRFKEIDALRGIAATMVVLFHFTMGRPEAKYGFEVGTTGVDLFFIISGFVIFMSISKVKNGLDFIINRVSRLYPTYWACVSCTAVLFSYQLLKTTGSLNRDFIIKYFGNITMFQFYLHIPNLDEPYWTMIIEMIFYIGILLLFYFKMLKYINIIGIAGTLSVVMINTMYYHPLLAFIMKWIPLFQFIPLFFAGIIFYKLYTQKIYRLEYYSILILCLFSQIFMYEYSGRSHNFVNQTEYTIMQIVYFTLFTLFVEGKLQFIVSKLTLFLGKISFALYLIHQGISINIIIPYFYDTLKLNFWIASLCIALPIVIIIATAITFVIEIPLQKAMKKKLQIWLL
jgi:peptidoglycan/LPS O-acetylase OafA/YrhL